MILFQVPLRQYIGEIYPWADSCFWSTAITSTALLAATLVCGLYIPTLSKELQVGDLKTFEGQRLFPSNQARAQEDFIDETIRPIYMAMYFKLPPRVPLRSCTARSQALWWLSSCHSGWRHMQLGSTQKPIVQQRSSQRLLRRLVSVPPSGIGETIGCKVKSEVIVGRN